MRIHLYDRSSHEPGPSQPFWGDHWVRVLMGHAFEELGHRLVDNPYRSDLNFYCWGKAPAKRAVPPGKLNVAWFYSHPELMTLSELRKYSIVFCTSATWIEQEANGQIRDAEAVVKYLPPCSHLFGTADPVLIRPSTDRMIQGKNFVNQTTTQIDAECPDVVFIGNARPSRGGRPVADYLLDRRDLAFSFGVWGRNWNRAGDRWIAKYHDFWRLQDLYHSAKVVLIDHQTPMAIRGFLKHQVLDVIAAGGLPLVDPVKLSDDGAIQTHWPTYFSPADARIQLAHLTSLTEADRKRICEKMRAQVPPLTFLGAAKRVIAAVENL